MVKTFRMRVRPQGVAMAVVLTLLALWALWQREGLVLLLCAALLSLVLDGLLHGACVVDGECLRVHTHRFRQDRVVPLGEVSSVELWRGCAVVHLGLGERPLVLCLRDAEGFRAWLARRHQTTPHEHEDE